MPNLAQLSASSNQLYQRWHALWEFLWSDRALVCDEEYLTVKQAQEKMAFEDLCANIRQRITLLKEL